MLTVTSSGLIILVFDDF